MNKTMEVSVDYIKGKLGDQVPVFIAKLLVEIVGSLKFLTVNIYDDLSWAQP